MLPRSVPRSRFTHVRVFWARAPVCLRVVAGRWPAGRRSRSACRGGGCRAAAGGPPDRSDWRPPAHRRAARHKLALHPTDTHRGSYVSTAPSGHTQRFIRQHCTQRTHTETSYVSTAPRDVSTASSGHTHRFVRQHCTQWTHRGSYVSTAPSGHTQRFIRQHCTQRRQHCSQRRQYCIQRTHTQRFIRQHCTQWTHTEVHTSALYPADTHRGSYVSTAASGHTEVHTSALHPADTQRFIRQHCTQRTHRGSYVSTAPRDLSTAPSGHTDSRSYTDRQGPA